MTRYIPDKLRQLVFERAGGCCEYCRLGQGQHSIRFAVDHIIAEKHGGSTEEDNLCWSCYWCNTYKGTDVGSIDVPFGGDYVRLYHPRKDVWEDHFQLKVVEIVPLTPQGRVTANILRMNVPARVSERKMLLILNQYPCQPVKPTSNAE
jgi:hypothetical protein